MYTDDLPITRDPPFEYLADMTEIQRTMLKAYIADKQKIGSRGGSGEPHRRGADELYAHEI